MSFDAYLEDRLREWATFYVGIKEGNVGWPKESPMSKVMVVGILTRSPGPRAPYSHPRAEQVNAWVNYMAARYPTYAEAIELCYFNPHLHYKVLARKLNISVSTLKARRQAGKIWLDGYLTTQNDLEREGAYV